MHGLRLPETNKPILGTMEVGGLSKKSIIFNRFLISVLLMRISLDTFIFELPFNPLHYLSILIQCTIHITKSDVRVFSSVCDACIVHSL